MILAPAVAKVFKSSRVQTYSMRHCLRIEVDLKAGHSDPEGETTVRALQDMGYEVDSVRVGKVYHLVLEAKTRRDAVLKAEEISRRLLANPTKDDYSVSFEETK